MKKHKRKSLIPNRKPFIGERTLNDTLRNTARALKWLAPRVVKRKYLDSRYAAFINDAAFWLRGCADEHETKVARRVRAWKKRGK